MGRPLQVSKLDLVGRVLRTQGERELNLEEFVLLVPFDLIGKVEARRDCCQAGRLLEGAGWGQLVGKFDRRTQGTMLGHPGTRGSAYLEGLFQMESVYIPGVVGVRVVVE